MSVIIGLCILLAVVVTYSLHRDRKKPVEQFDPEAPTIEPVSLTPSEQAAELTAIVEAGPTAFTLRPNWDEAPEWAMWAAQHEYGSVSWFQVRPEVDELRECWHTPFADHVGLHVRAAIIHARGPANPNWKQAIEQRPVEAKPDIFVFADSPDPATWVTTEGVSLPAPERDNCELISRDELERLRAVERMHNATSSALDDLCDAAEEFCATKSEKAYLRLCKVLEVTP